MIIPITCREKEFYRYYTELLNPIMELRKRALDVLAELMYHYQELSSYPEDIKWKLLFDYDTKKKIAEELDISMDVLNNNLTELRKKNIIIDGKLVKACRIQPKDDKYELTFRFSFIGEIYNKEERADGATPSNDIDHGKVDGQESDAQLSDNYKDGSTS